MGIYKDGTKIASTNVTGDTLPIGGMIPWTSNTIPDNWLLCDGQAVSRTTYASLFAVVSTTYGVGDNSTTFNVPNIKGRTIVGRDSADTDFDVLGETRGAKTHTLTVSEIPQVDVQGSISGTAGDKVYRSYVSGGISDTFGGTIGTTLGGGQAHNNIQPSIVENYIIKTAQSSGIVATVVDNLTSTSTTNALSANQGKVLNDRLGNSIGFIANQYITSGNGTITGNTTVNWSNAGFGGTNKGLSKIGDSSDLIVTDSGAVKYTHDGTISFIEVDVFITGYPVGLCTIWFGGNGSTLNNAVLVTPMGGAAHISYVGNAEYGTGMTKLIYDVSGMTIDDTFLIDPTMLIRGSNFTPNNGGTKSFITLKGYKI